MKKYTEEEFIGKAICLHGDLYDYSKVVMEKGNPYARLTCKKTGEEFLLILIMAYKISKMEFLDVPLAQ